MINKDDYDFSVFSQANPTLKEFDHEYRNACTYVSPANNLDVSSHSVVPTVSVSCVNSDDDFELIGIEVDRYLCGCEVGMTFKIRKVGGDSNE